MILYKIKEPEFEERSITGGHPLKLLVAPAGEIRIYHDSAMGRAGGEWNVLIDSDNPYTIGRIENVGTLDKAIAMAQEEYYKQVCKWLEEVVIK